MQIDGNGKLSSPKVDTTGISVIVNDNVYYLFSFKYQYEGRAIDVEFWALDYPDALMRVEAMRETARYNGQIIEKVNAEDKQIGG